jgi:hypothetical protein
MTYEEWGLQANDMLAEAKRRKDMNGGFDTDYTPGVCKIYTDWTADRAILLGLLRDMVKTCESIVDEKNITEATEGEPYVVLSLTPGEWQDVRDARADAAEVLAGEPEAGGEEET